MLFRKSERRRSYVSQLTCQYTAQKYVGHSSQGPKTLNLAVGTGTASALSRIFYVQEPEHSFLRSLPHSPHVPHRVRSIHADFLQTVSGCTCRLSPRRRIRGTKHQLDTQYQTS